MFSVGCSVVGRRKTLHAVVLAVCVLSCIELLSLGIGRYLERCGVFYRSRPAEDYAEYLRKRDPVLGWPAPETFDGNLRDASGSRIVPAFPNPEVEPLISLYGDSFTWSTEVDNEHAWGNVLATMVGRRVANFGVSGYGTDQSFLRFLVNSNDAARIVVLGHLSENILRNVNQFRDLLYPGEGKGFKPRFVLGEGGNLELIPLPKFEPDIYPDAVAYPDKYLDHEFFAPGGESGVVAPAFPWSFSVLGCLGNAHVRAKLAGRPRYGEFYSPNHSSRALQLTAAIIGRFIDVAKERGKAPVVVIMPTTLDIAHFRRSGRWSYRPLVEMLSRRGIGVIDIGVQITGPAGDRRPEVLFANVHFNEEGNAAVAGIVHAGLIARGLLP